MNLQYRFLRAIACNYQLTQAQARVFLQRFAYENMEERNEEIANNLKIEPATVQSHMRKIYQKFADDPHCQCELNRSRGSRGQFRKLFHWLWEEKFREWLNNEQMMSHHSNSSAIWLLGAESNISNSFSAEVVYF